MKFINLRSLVAIMLALTISSCSEKDTKYYRDAQFAEISGWENENIAPALNAFITSCAKFEGKQGLVHTQAVFGTGEQWRSVCAELKGTEAGDLKALIERRLKPVELLPEDGKEALFTGYYTPQIEGSFYRSGTFNVPIYKKPSDLISSSLGDFDEDLRGKTIIGRVDGAKFKPYPTRAELEKHLKRSHVLVWLKSPIDAFFLHIQGSGQVKLPNGQVIQVGYAANNGHKYTAIGKKVAELSGIEPAQITMPKIKQWLEENPDAAQDVMNANQRFIFFSRLNMVASVGAAGLALEANNSIAVDPAFVPLNMPMFLSTETSVNGKAFNRMVMAQDTGSAIKGSARADIYFGTGAEAAELAGAQRGNGKIYALVPRS